MRFIAGEIRIARALDASGADDLYSGGNADRHTGNDAAILIDDQVLDTRRFAFLERPTIGAQPDPAIAATVFRRGAARDIFAALIAYGALDLQPRTQHVGVRH